MDEWQSFDVCRPSSKDYEPTGLVQLLSARHYTTELVNEHERVLLLEWTHWRRITPKGYNRL